MQHNSTAIDTCKKERDVPRLPHSSAAVFSSGEAVKLQKGKDEIKAGETSAKVFEFLKSSSSS